MRLIMNGDREDEAHGNNHEENSYFINILFSKWWKINLRGSLVSLIVDFSNVCWIEVFHI